MVISAFVRATLLFAPLLFLAACDTPAAQARKAAPAGVAWRQLGTWTGHGNAQTESFTSNTGTLRVRWEAKSTAEAPRSAGPLFRLAAHSAISGRLLQPVVEHDGAGEGIGYVQQDPHVLYMVVESNHLTWKVTVEEAVSYP